MGKLINILGAVALCFIIGFIVSNAQAESLESWYPMLIKSPLTPPGYVFGIVWTVLYVCIGVSMGLLLSLNIKKKIALITFGLMQLVLNLVWSFVFFKYQSPLGGLIVIIFLDIVVAYYIALAFKVAKYVALLFVPYLLWLCFATYLNGYILACN
ncbi:MAG: tryptophan-rich sensory protein [Muribaculaceae bacterium]|nr:tryptophan-rich sensory protein [Muribaculaceae bacterium]